MNPSIVGTRKKRGRGRPATGAKSVHLRLLPDNWAQIDGWRAQQPDNPSRPEAIRRLIELGLNRPVARNRKLKD